MKNYNTTVLIVWFMWITVVLIVLTGCATTKAVNISCIPHKDATASKNEIAIELPFFVVDGAVLYYGDDDKLHRLRDATCGIK